MEPKHIAPPCWGDTPFVEYLCEVDRLLHEQHGITAEDLDAAAAAQEAGESPQEHADWIAENRAIGPLPRPTGG
jgi:hypothetical protein